MRQTLQGSFSAVSKRNFTSKNDFESSRRDLHNALLCTALKSHVFLKNLQQCCQKIANFTCFKTNTKYEMSHKFCWICWICWICWMLLFKFERQLNFLHTKKLAELCKGVHCVDLGESFQTHIYLQNLASIQPRTRPLKFVGSRAPAGPRRPVTPGRRRGRRRPCRGGAGARRGRPPPGRSGVISWKSGVD